MVYGKTIVAAALALFVVTAPSLADHRRDDHRHGRHAHGDRRQVAGHARYGYVDRHGRTPRAHVHYGHGRHHGPHGRYGFVVPRKIHRTTHVHYAPYYHGTTWSRAHRHDHAVYTFPVRTGHGYVYRPHSYCGGRLIDLRAPYRGPRFSIGVSF